MELPCPTAATLDVDSANVGVMTFSVNEVVAVSDPDVPVIVTVLALTVAVGLAVNVTMEELVVGFVEKTAVTPVGRPEIDRFTLPMNPYSSLTYTYVEPEWPCPTAIAPEVDNVNVGVMTFNVSGVVAVSDPDVPVIVTTAPDSTAAMELAVNVIEE